MMWTWFTGRELAVILTAPILAFGMVAFVNAWLRRGAR